LNIQERRGKNGEKKKSNMRFDFRVDSIAGVYIQHCSGAGQIPGKYGLYFHPENQGRQKAARSGKHAAHGI
jgi:hypothetical protein